MENTSSKKQQRRRNILIVLSLFLLLIGWLIYDNARLVENTFTIKSDKISSPVLIAHLSDDHNSSYHQQIIQKLSDKDLDLIVITGDLIDEKTTDLDSIEQFLKELTELSPVYYVTGNHDVNTHLFTDLLALFEDCQVHYLSDETRLFNEEISISGLNDAVIGFDINQLNLDDSKFNLVLSHRPELFETYIKVKMDLVLSGHAHGGQFRLPLIGGIIAPKPRFLTRLH